MYVTKRRGSTRSDHGFTVVEVIIAVLLLAAVMSAITMAATGGVRLQGAAKAQAAMTNAGKRVLEELRTDREWMERSDCRRSGCVLDAFVERDLLHDRSVDGAFVLEFARATPIDSAADGSGDADRDGIVPDFYRIEVRLAGSSDVMSRFGRMNPRTMIVTIDQRGDIQKGALTIEFCEVLNQADDRMQVQGCPISPAAGIRMNGCPTPERRGCSAAFGWVAALPQHERERSPFVMLKRVPYGKVPEFTLVNTLDPKQRISSNDAKQVDGNYVFQNIESGTYRLEGLRGSISGTTERWELKESPSYHGQAGDAVEASINVEAGVRSRALVLFRPKMTDRGLRLHFQRRTHTYPITGPHKSTEVAIPKSQKEPTDSYIGTSADYWCGLIRRGTGRTYAQKDEETGEVKYGNVVVTKPSCRIKEVRGNCVQLFATFGLEATIDFFGLSFTYVVEPVDEHYMGIICSYYAEYYEHTFYKVGTRSARLRNGAAKEVTYYMEPKPDYRHLVVGPDKVPNVVLPQCKTTFKGQCRPIGGAPDVQRTLVPGLNTSLLGTSRRASDEQVNAQATRTFGRTALPPPTAGIDRPGGTWVRPDGSIVTAAGVNMPAGSTYTFTGEGECYFVGPRTGGELQGDDSCNPCLPRWSPALTLRVPGAATAGGCSGAILTQFKWWRDAWEIVLIDHPFIEGFDRKEREVDLMDPAPKTTVLDPPWTCSTTVPIIFPGRSACAENTLVNDSGSTNGPVSLGATKHTGSSSGGVATVNSRVMGGG